MGAFNQRHPPIGADNETATLYNSEQGNLFWIAACSDISLLLSSGAREYLAARHTVGTSLAPLQSLARAAPITEPEPGQRMTRPCASSFVTRQAHARAWLLWCVSPQPCTANVRRWFAPHELAMRPHYPLHPRKCPHLGPGLPDCILINASVIFIFALLPCRSAAAAGQAWYDTVGGQYAAHRAP